MAIFETYHALLTLTENNMRVIHWKLKGDDFNVTHSRYGMYYEKLGEMMDETAEQIMGLLAQSDETEPDLVVGRCLFPRF